MKRLSFAAFLLLISCGPSESEKRKAEVDRLKSVAQKAEEEAEKAMTDVRENEARFAKMEGLFSPLEISLARAETRLRSLQPNTPDYDILLQEIAALQARITNERKF